MKSTVWKLPWMITFPWFLEHNLRVVRIWQWSLKPPWWNWRSHLSRRHHWAVNTELFHNLLCCWKTILVGRSDRLSYWALMSPWWNWRSYLSRPHHWACQYETVPQSTLSLGRAVRTVPQFTVVETQYSLARPPWLLTTYVILVKLSFTP